MQQDDYLEDAPYGPNTGSTWSPYGTLLLLLLGSLIIIAAMWLISKRPQASQRELRTIGIASSTADASLPVPPDATQCVTESWRAGERI